MRARAPAASCAMRRLGAMVLSMVHTADAFDLKRLRCTRRVCEICTWNAWARAGLTNTTLNTLPANTNRSTMRLDETSVYTDCSSSIRIPTSAIIRRVARAQARASARRSPHSVRGASGTRRACPPHSQVPSPATLHAVAGRHSTSTRQSKRRTRRQTPEGELAGRMGESLQRSRLLAISSPPPLRRAPQSPRTRRAC